METGCSVGDSSGAGSSEAFSKSILLPTSPPKGCIFFLDSKCLRASQSLYWFTSYGDFAKWVDFAYWWNLPTGGVPLEGSAPAACAAGLFQIIHSGDSLLN